MLVYNTLTKKKEEFIPIKGKEVKMYMCGPTVYDYFHIGNGRSFIMADILRRYLEYKGYDVKFVMNLTDVDDKIIKKANQEGVDSNEVTQKYIDAFFEDLAKLKIKKATIYPKATEHMQEIIDIIQVLESKGMAYNTNGNVFYNVNKFEEYGKLSGKNINDLEAGARIEINEEKQNPLDFSLWKKAKEGEPYWESPWGKGRPGWHIECSAMSMKHLGESIDIHMGGSDLVFPHHENEIAQSEACTGHNFVKYWIHFGFLNIKNEKMSKSLGNFFTARDIVKLYPAEAIRMFLSQTHYAGPLNFSEELIQAAQTGLSKITEVAKTINSNVNKSESNENQTIFNFDEYYKKFEEAMDDDFNTPKAIAVLFDFVKSFNKYVSEKINLEKDFYIKSKEFMTKTAENVLGIVHFDELEVTNTASLENELIELLIKLRIDAKLEKNYPLSDKIRNELNSIGIELQDSKTGTTYKKTKL